MNIPITALTAAAVSLAIASAASAAHLVEFNTDGDYEGFVDFRGAGADRITGDTVAGGVLSGTIANGDAQLRRFTTDGSTNFSVPLADYTGLELRLAVDYPEANFPSAVPNFTVVFYNDNPSGDPAVNNPAASTATATYTRDITADGSFQVYTINFTDAPNVGAFANFTNGQLEGLRVDPINTPASIGSTFQLDYVRLIEAPAIPEPASLGLLGVAALGLTRRRKA